jgi:hypothetical protein
VFRWIRNSCATEVVGDTLEVTGGQERVSDLRGYLGQEMNIASVLTF